ncbi:MAG: ribbon-helix-helix protein, CopG family [Acidobacteriota bacterium]
MRTTLSLDADVAALIEQIRKKKDASLKEVVNAALREGLTRMVDPPAPRKKFHMTVHDPGRCYLPNLDNTAEVLAFAEGEWFK